MRADRGRTHIRRSAPYEPRVAQTNTAGNYRIHGYDASGQLTAAHGFEANGLARPHELWDYGYHAAGNLAHRTNNALRQDFR
jgi:hypothetical protein